LQECAVLVGNLYDEQCRADSCGNIRIKLTAALEAVASGQQLESIHMLIFLYQQCSIFFAVIRIILSNKTLDFYFSTAI